MAKQSSTEKAECWKLAIAEQVASGLSIRAFCREQLLSEPSFHAWKRKLGERAQPIKSPLLTPVRVVSDSSLSGATESGSGRSRRPDIHTRIPDYRTGEAFRQWQEGESIHSEKLDFLLPDVWLKSHPDHKGTIDEVRRKERKQKEKRPRRRRKR